jgi:hypothetical protein
LYLLRFDRTSLLSPQIEPIKKALIDVSTHRLRQTGGDPYDENAEPLTHNFQAIGQICQTGKIVYRLQSLQYFVASAFPIDDSHSS